MRGPIAVFDSGVGGLTVVKELLKQLPQEAIVYFGDTARAPYGPRPKQEIIQFTEEIVHDLQRYHPKLVVIACNTATAVALDRVKKELSIPIVGVIEPGARAALKATKTGYIAVIGTEGTIKSKAYEEALLTHASNVRIMSQACPAFVPLVEKGEYRSSKAYSVVQEAIGHMRSYPIDCLILGCTHYPFLSDTIAKVMGSDVKLIHSAEETAREVGGIIAELNKKKLEGTAMISSQQKRTKELQRPEIVHRFICSGDLTTFRAIAEEWLGLELKKRKVIYERKQP